MTLSQSELDSKLRDLGPDLLKPMYRPGWTKDNPTWGYCYIVSEALYHYVFPRSQSYAINFGSLGVHWFLIDENFNVIDMTGNQFKFRVPYGNAKKCHFFQGSIRAPRGFISKRGHAMAQYLDLI